MAIVGPPPPAPVLWMRDASGRLVPLIDAAGGPVVLALASRWLSPRGNVDDRLRAELRGLGATLVVMTPEGVVRLRPDDAPDALEPDAAGWHGFGDPFALFGVAAELARGDAVVMLVDAKGAQRSRHVIAAEAQEAPEAILAALEAAAAAMRATAHRPLLITRREVVTTALVAAFALLFADGCEPPPQPATPPAPAPGAPGSGKSEVEITLHLNGAPRTLTVEPRVTLLDALRERLGLTGAKKGCDHGQCGACTVLVDGRRVLSCLSLAVVHDRGPPITTIEGLAKGEELHPVQAAFLEHDGFQCGYCTPGQILSAVALLRENRAKTDGEVREQMSGNLCRCGAYPNIVAAIQGARGKV